MRVRSFFIAILVGVAVFCLLASGGGSAVAGTTYYVDRNHPSNSDANPGTVGLPFRTIARGACGARPGDIIVVKGGTENSPVLYPERVVFGAYLSPSCGPGGPLWSTIHQAGVYLTIRAAPRRGVLMYGFANSRKDGNQRGWLHIEGFRITTEVLGGTLRGFDAPAAASQRVVDNAFRDITQAAILVGGPGSHVVRLNEVVRANKGIEVDGNGYRVEDNAITGLTNFGYDVDYLRFFGRDGVIRRNRFYGTDLAPANIRSAHVDCMQTWASASSWVQNIVIEDNLCADAHQGVFARTRSGAITSVIVRNNLFMRIRAWGTMISNEDVTVGRTGRTDMFFYSNVVAHISIHGFGCRGFASCEVRNNIFFDGGSNYGSTGSGVIRASHNLLYRTRGTISGFSHPGNVLGRDPLFLDPGSPDNLGSLGDFHVQAGSPTIDAGIALEGFAHDMVGTPRPQGSAWDIGPYEHRTSGERSPAPTGPRLGSPAENRGAIARRSPP
jgi:hypothetical protein